MSVTKKSKKGRPGSVPPWIARAAPGKVAVRVTTAERERWASAARRSGFSDLSDWIRAICNQHVDVLS